jgi:hypothetical protein
LFKHFCLHGFSATEAFYLIGAEFDAVWALPLQNLIWLLQIDPKKRHARAIFMYINGLV